MTQLVMVYDEKGEPFEVGHELAAQLVLNKGWSRVAPSPEPEMAVEAEPAAAVTDSTDRPASPW